MSNDWWLREMSRRQLLKNGAVLAVGASVLGAAGLAGCGSSSTSAGSSSAPSVKAEVDGDLYYFGWSDYCEPTLISRFESEYGVKVHQTFFDSDEAMVAKVASGLPFDCVITNSGYLQKLVKGGLLRKLPHDQLKNFDNLTSYFHDPFYDPDATYSVPYGYGGAGIAWRTDLVDSSSMTQSWNDLWNHPAAKGKIFMLDVVGYLLGASLARLGYSINSTVSEELDKAADAIIELKPMLGGFTSSDQLAAGNGWIEQTWGGTVYQALTQVKDPSVMQFETCKESPIMGSDLMSIPVAAKHPGTALLFIDWLLQAEHSAKNVKYMGYPSGTTSGDAAYNELTKAYPWLQTSSADLNAENTWKIAAEGQALTLWNNAQSRIMAT
jgi:spermidine/putrescine transport system substrate-binding protein